jgi:2-polyprenyl-3-methyl-5-hydroxy-6-metoxy-1,4-benzoquinol methylase
MKLIPCNSCGSFNFEFLFEKESSLKEKFQIQKCRNCGLVQVNPQPSFEEVKKYYSDEYFEKRTDRGYDNYYSEKIKTEIERVFQLNLNELSFFEWESSLGKNKNALDIGCAAGYFVNFLKNRGWNSKGIEIASGPIQYAREKWKLEIIEKDFLEWDKEANEKFDLITLWASIEHLHHPSETLSKISKHLKPKGRMIVSTCRYGILAKMKGVHWRFMNVPEHLYYYSFSGLKKSISNTGLRYISSLSYGSGMTSKKNMSIVYRVFKKILDWLVKYTNQGDMMVFCFEKNQT